MPVTIEDEQFAEFERAKAGYCITCKVFDVARPLARESVRKCASCGTLTEIAFLDAYEQGEFHKRSDGIEDDTDQSDDEDEDDEDDEFFDADDEDEDEDV